MKIGHIIKSERIRQKIKQIVLVKGICTPSYLSRIEQDQVSASEEIYSLLLNRLGIDYRNIIKIKNRNDNTFLIKVIKIYEEVVTRRDREFAKEQLNILNAENYLLEDRSSYFTLKLISLRCKLIIGESFSELIDEFEVLSKQFHTFSENQKFIYLINEGIWFYELNKFKDAILKFEEAIGMDIKLKDWELAEVNYIIGLSYISDNRIAASVTFVNKALDYFKSKFIIKRVIDCYLLKGISYKRTFNFIEAESYYLEIVELCHTFNIQNRLGCVYHNLGALYSIKGDIEEGIAYMLKSLEYKKEDKGKLTTIHALIVEYSKMSKQKEVHYWCKKGLNLLKLLSPSADESFYHHFIFYESLYCEHGLSQNIANQTINYFSILQEFNYAQKYSIKLAEDLFHSGKYKFAAIKFMEANKFNYLNNRITSWEGL